MYINLVASLDAAFLMILFLVVSFHQKTFMPLDDHLWRHPKSRRCMACKPMCCIALDIIKLRAVTFILYVLMNLIICQLKNLSYPKPIPSAVMLSNVCQCFLFVILLFFTIYLCWSIIFCVIFLNIFKARTIVKI